MSIPVTLVHGWFDGAAELIARQLADAAGDGAVLLHPAGLGAEALAEEVAFRSPGCRCCAVRVDLVDALGRLARRRARPELVVVSALPGADVAAAVVTILDDPDLRSGVHLHGIVTCVDARLPSTIGAEADTSWPDGLTDPLLLADHLVVLGTEQLTEHGVATAGWAMRAANPTARIHLGDADIAGILATCQWALGGLEERFRGPMAVAAPNAVSTRNGSFTLHVDGRLDADRLEEWVSELQRHAGHRLLRVEGVLAIDGNRHRTCVQGSRAVLRSAPGTRWHPSDRIASHVRVVGRGLDPVDLLAKLAACAT